MLQLLVGTDIPFMRYRRFAYVFSSLILAATLVWFFAKGPRYSVDFTGGTLLQIRTSEVVHADKLRTALESEGIQAELQQMTGENPNEYLIRFRTQGDPVTLVQSAIAKHLPGVTMELRGNQTVGPKVGSDLRQKAIMAILTSLGAILLYVGIRYEFKFALGGVAALFHDVLVTMGFLMFTGREVSLTVVAALLTIAGYSINAVANGDHGVHGVPGGAGPVHLGRRRAARLLLRHAGGGGVRHVLVGVRGERHGSRYLDRAGPAQGCVGRVSQ
jgi:preprotein translocase subunit SecF